MAPSAVRAAGKIYTDSAGMQEHDMPRALGLAEIRGVIEEYATATRKALAAGCDGGACDAKAPRGAASGGSPCCQ